MLSVDTIVCRPYWHKIHPVEKVFFALVQVCLASIFDAWLAGMVSLLLSFFLLQIVAPEQKLQVLALMLVPVAFLIPACFAVAVVVGNADYIGSFHIAGIALGVTYASISEGAHLFLRAFASSSVLILVALTTPVDHLEYLLAKMRVPAVLVELFGLIYRFIGFLVAVFAQIQNAQRARAARKTFLASLSSAGLFASALLRKALWYQVWASYAAEARCYSGMQIYSRFPFSFSLFRLLIVAFYGFAVVLLQHIFNR